MPVTNPSYSSDPTDFSKFYSNGTIPDCDLKSPPGLPGVKLHPQAAEQLNKLVQAATAAGYRFKIISAYRTYDTQVQLVGGSPDTIKRGVAKAGTSKHGWGTAIDIGELWDESIRVAKEFADSKRPIPTSDGNSQWDMLDGEVHAYIRQNNSLYKWLDENAPKFGWVNPDWARNGGNYDECWHWEYRVFSANWPTILPNTLTDRPTQNIKALTAPCGTITSNLYYARVPTNITPAPYSITPYIGSLDSFHPNIQYELTRRRVAKETANTYMPFIKLTSLTGVFGRHLQGGTDSDENIRAYAPSLGPHGVYEGLINFNEIYLPQSNRSIVGYAMQESPTTTTGEGTDRSIIQVPVVVSNDDAQTRDQQNIPMPGIIEANIERGTAGPMGVRGGLVKADLKILAYSIGQLNTLLTYFLRPATRVVLELGRKSSDPNEDINPFNWGKPKDDLAKEFTSLIYNPNAQRLLIKEKVYDNFGRYEIFIGYVVKFDLKYTKNNVYEISLTVHSVQQFEIPTIHSGVKSVCSDASNRCRAMDVREYFDEANAWKPNTFKQLMSRVESKAAPTAAPTTGTGTTDASGTTGTTPRVERDNWTDHFIAIKNSTPQDAGASRPAGLDENEYFVSWRFFVEKILGDNELGLISVMPEDDETTSTPSTEAVPAGTAAETAPDIQRLSTRNLLRLGLLRAVSPQPSGSVPDSRDLLANEVGYHPALRSTNPEVMIINNPQAQELRTDDDKQSFESLVEGASTDDEQRANFQLNTYLVDFIKKSAVGNFTNKLDSSTKPGSAFLDEGIWINTKAIKQAFNSADTITSGINSLLTMMNAATQGYWNLQLYSTDRVHSGLFVIDMGLSKKIQTNNSKSNTDPDPENTDLNSEDKQSILSSADAITPNRYKLTGTGIAGSQNQQTNDLQDPNNRPNFIYMFNRGTKLLPDGSHLGSDIIDLNVEFNLPQVIAVQAIAGVGGPAQKSTLQSIKIKELQDLSLIPNLFAPCDSTGICRDDDCGRDNISTLESNWKAAENAATVAQDNYKRLSEVPPPTNPDGTPLTSEQLTASQATLEVAQREQEQALSLKEETRSKYFTALAQRNYGNGMVIDKVRELASLGTLLELVEFNQTAMMKKLNRDSTNAEEGRITPPAHAFNSSNLTKTTVNLTLPGIGGIELFQSFVVDRVPSILKRGFYVVTKVVHKFSSANGWTTSIEGRFRFKPTADDSGIPDADPCPPGSRTSGASGTSGVAGRPATTGGSVSGTPGVSAGSRPTPNRDREATLLAQYTIRIQNMNNQTLREEFEYLEKNVEEFRILGLSVGTSATREQWRRKVENGTVDRLRKQFELVKTEIRKRNSAGLTARRGIPEEFTSISDRRLVPIQWPPAR